MLSNILRRIRAPSVSSFNLAESVGILHSVNNLKLVKKREKEKVNVYLMNLITKQKITKIDDFSSCCESVGIIVSSMTYVSNQKIDDKLIKTLIHISSGSHDLVSFMKLSSMYHFIKLRLLCTKISKDISTKKYTEIMDNFDASTRSIIGILPACIDRSRIFSMDFDQVELPESPENLFPVQSTNIDRLRKFLFISSQILPFYRSGESPESVPIRKIFLLSVSAYRQITMLVKIDPSQEIPHKNIILLQRITTQLVHVMCEAQKHNVLPLQDAKYCLRLLNRIVPHHVEIEQKTKQKLITLKCARYIWKILFRTQKKQEPFPKHFVKVITSVTEAYLENMGSIELFGILCALANHYPTIDQKFSEQVFANFVRCLKNSEKSDSNALSARSTASPEVQIRLKQMCEALRAAQVLHISETENADYLQKSINAYLSNLSSTNGVVLRNILDIDILDASLGALAKIGCKGDGRALFEEISKHCIPALQKAEASRVFRCISALSQIASKVPNKSMFRAICEVAPDFLPEANHSQLISLALYLMRAAPRGEAAKLSEAIYHRLRIVLQENRIEASKEEHPSDRFAVSTHDVSVWLRFFCMQETDAPEALVTEILSIIVTSKEALKQEFLSVSLLYYISRYHHQKIHEAYANNPSWLSTMAATPLNSNPTHSQLLLDAFAKCISSFNDFLPQLAAKQCIFVLKALAAFPITFRDHMQSVVNHLLNLQSAHLDWSTAAIFVQIMAHKRLTPRSAVSRFLDSLCAEGFHGIRLQNVCHIYTGMALLRIFPNRLHRDIWLQFVNMLQNVTPKQLAAMLEARTLYKAQKLVGILIEDDQPTVLAESEQNVLLTAACRQRLSRMSAVEAMICGACFHLLGVPTDNLVYGDIVSKVASVCARGESHALDTKSIRIANFHRMLFALNSPTWDVLNNTAPITSQTQSILKALSLCNEGLWRGFLPASAMLVTVREIGQRLVDEPLPSACAAHVLAWKPVLHGISAFIRTLATLQQRFGDKVDALKDCLTQPQSKGKTADDSALVMLSAVVDPEHILTILKEILWLIENLYAEGMVAVDELAVDGTFFSKQLLPQLSPKDLVASCDFLLKALHAVCHRLPMKRMETVYAFVEAMPIASLGKSKALVLGTMNTFCAKKKAE